MAVSRRILSILFFTILSPIHAFQPSHRPQLRPITYLCRAKNQHHWEGDDLRWSSRLQRRFSFSLTKSRQRTRNTIITLNIIMFVYQCIDTVNWIRRRHPNYWPSQAMPIVVDVLVGASQPGPLTLDFCHSQLSRWQPHRLLTSGFLHGSIIHLFCNMDALSRLPAWLSTGLGIDLYLTAYLASIVAGNLGHTLFYGDSLGLGASGGICGLYGLLYISLARMGNGRAAERVLKGIGVLFVYGLLIPGISNAAHMAGFVGGLSVGFLCGPRYYRSYAARRKWSTDIDLAPADYRAAMGFDRRPESPLIPLPVIWLAVGVIVAWRPVWRAMPRLIWQGLVHPGSVTAMLQR